MVACINYKFYFNKKTHDHSNFFSELNNPNLNNKKKKAKRIIYIWITKRQKDKRTYESQKGKKIRELTPRRIGLDAVLELVELLSRSPRGTFWKSKWWWRWCCCLWWWWLLVGVSCFSHLFCRLLFTLSLAQVAVNWSQPGLTTP